MNGLTAASITAWSSFLLYMLVGVLRLWKWFPYSEIILILVVPATMIVLSLWIRFRLAAQSPRRSALSQTLILSFGLLAIANVLMPRS
jgi:hypothetical protein